MPNYPDSIQDLEPLSGLYIRKRFLNEVRTFLDQKHPQGWCIAVSYTHLTLPTNREV